jgi:hypothetical protein
MVLVFSLLSVRILLAAFQGLSITPSVGRSTVNFRTWYMQGMATWRLSKATAGAAKPYKQDDRGTIATVMRADLLLLKSNSFENITSTLDINAAWVGGIPIGTITAQKGQTCDPTSLGL